MRRRDRLPLAVGVVAAALVGGLAIAAISAHIPDEDELLLVCLFSLVSELWIGVGAFLGALFVLAPPSATLGLGRSRLAPRELALLALGTLAASHALDGAAELSGHAQDSALSELPRLLHGATGVQAAAAIVSLGVAPAIAEELLCRGLIQRGLVRRFGPWVGIPVAASVFGALHVEPLYALFAALLGLYLGLAAWWADSTRAAMICHGTNNLAAVGLAVHVSGAWATPASTLGAAALALACLWAVGRSRSGFPGGPEPAGPSEPTGPTGPTERNASAKTPI